MKQICSSVKLFSYPAYYENDGTLVLMEGDAMKDDGLPEKVRIIYLSERRSRTAVSF